MVIEEKVAMWRKEISANAELNATQVTLRGAITNILTDKFGLVPSNLVASLNKVSSTDDLNNLVTQVYKTESLTAFEQRINELH